MRNHKNENKEVKNRGETMRFVNDLLEVCPKGHKHKPFEVRAEISKDRKFLIIFWNCGETERFILLEF